MRITRLFFVACLWSAVSASLLAPSASAQFPAPVQSSAPGIAALPPLQGAAAVVDRAHAAKSLSELNPILTGETAAFLGLNLTITVQALNDLPFTYAPKRAPSVPVKAVRRQAAALLDSPWLTSHTFRSLNDTGTLPPSDADKGHQLLTNAVALDAAFEKTHSPNKAGTLNAQLGENIFPASSACDFHVLSPTRIKIEPKGNPARQFEAHLEGRQWHLDVGNKWLKTAPLIPPPYTKPALLGIKS